jgi:hypothetical protein
MESARLPNCVYRHDPFTSMTHRDTPRGAMSRRRLLLICTPAAGFDRFIYQASQPATAPGFPPSQRSDEVSLARLAAEAGNEVLGPLPEHRV